MSILDTITAAAESVTQAVTANTPLTSLYAHGDYPTISHTPSIADLIADIDQRPRATEVTDFYHGDYSTPLVGDETSTQWLDKEDIDFTMPEKGSLSAEAMENVINEALDVRGIEDPELREKWTQVLTLIGENESTSAPNAVNTWDKNYYGEEMSDGFKYHASRGWLQLVPDTFAQYHQPGTSDAIYDPVAQASATINYIEARHNVYSNGVGLDTFYQSRYPKYRGY